MSPEFGELITYRSGAAAGLELVRRDVEPAAGSGGGGEPVGVIVLVHGLGDHSGRYDEVVAVMARVGFAVTATDFPGHGLSPGKRGHLGGGVGEALGVIGESVAHARARWGDRLPIGIAAHSMGGFLAWLYLIGHPGVFRFAWTNGTLVDPAAGQSRVRLLLAGTLGRVLPSVTVSNGVSDPMCVHKKRADDPLIHRRVSLGLGASLVRESGRLAGPAIEVPGVDDVLMTHGGDDRVCRGELAREFFARVRVGRKRFVSFPEVRHESFLDDGKGAVLGELESWLRGVAAGLRGREPEPRPRGSAGGRDA